MRRLETRLCVFAIMALCATLFSAGAWGARTDFEVKSLRGLDTIYVIVQSLNPDMVNDGLTTEAVRSTVEQHVKSAGLKVLAKGESIPDSGGILLLSISSVKSSSGVYACNIDAELIQVTTLSRDPGIVSPATTWANGVVALVDSGSIKRLQDSVARVVDEFVSDYRTANSVELPNTGAT